MSSYFSPYAIMKGKALDFDKYKIPFGSFVQASHKAAPYNTQAPRTIDCIYLTPTDSGHLLMNLASGLQVT